MNWRSPAGNLAELVKSTGCKILFASKTFEQVATEIQSANSGLKVIFLEDLEDACHSSATDQSRHSATKIPGDISPFTPKCQLGGSRSAACLSGSPLSPRRQLSSRGSPPASSPAMYPKPIACNLNDVAAIFFTSGSTSLPKAVPHTHAPLSELECEEDR